MSEWFETSEADAGLPMTLDGARNILSYSRESDERLLGVFGQDSEIYDWASSSGYQIVGFARDNAVHGQTLAAERPGLSAAIEAIEEKKAAGIVVQRLDRLARDFATQDDAMQRIWKAGGRIFTCAQECQQEWKPDRPGDVQWTTRRAFAFRAEEEMYALLARLNNARKALMRRGGYGGGAIFGGRRYGSVIVKLQGKNIYVPIPAEQLVISRIKKTCVGGRGYAAFAKILNQERVPTVTGRPWTTKVVRSIALELYPYSTRLVALEPQPITEPITWVKHVAVAGD